MLEVDSTHRAYVYAIIKKEYLTISGFYLSFSSFALAPKAIGVGPKEVSEVGISSCSTPSTDVPD